VREIRLENIHSEAVKLGRSRKGMRSTANRLAGCDVDKQITDIVRRLKSSSWALEDEEIIKGCAIELWTQFLQAEINIQAP
jgi:hypothetical protein